jgi:hypothetical protein
LRPHTPIDAGGFHDDQLPVLKPLLADYLASRQIDDYLVWFYTPMALPLLAELAPRAIVYDCMDELSAFKDAPRQRQQREGALLNMADLVLTGGPSLYEARRGRNPHVHCIPNAVDPAHFAPARLVEEGVCHDVRHLRPFEQRVDGHMDQPRPRRGERQQARQLALGRPVRHPRTGRKPLGGKPSGQQPDTGS